MIIDKVLGIPLKNEIGAFFTGAYQIQTQQHIEEVLVIYHGDIKAIKNVRINSACYTGDLFHCDRCDCNSQLTDALDFICQNDGLIIYMLSQDGRGCGTVNKLKSLQLMDKNNATTKNAFEQLGLTADARDCSNAIAILNDLQINDINLITNNPDKIASLEAAGIRVVDRIPLISNNPHIRNYLQSKKNEFNHMIDF